MLNHYPWWKNILILLVVVVAIVYAAPIFFGDDPAVQVSNANTSALIGQDTEKSIANILQQANVPFKEIDQQKHGLLVRFSSEDLQLKGKELLEEKLGENYLVALNLAAKTPHWLTALGAIPMKLGLDLRGGVHLLMQVDVDSVIKQRIEGDLNSISAILRGERIRYTGITRLNNEGVRLQFRTSEDTSNAMQVLTSKFPEFAWEQHDLTIEGVLQPAALQQIRQDTLEQNMNTLRNRVNELGVSEAIVQQQGASRIAVDLPGVQDTAQAKSILGNTTALEFHMVDTDNDARNAVQGMAPIGTKLYNFEGQPVLLKNQVILRGSSITSARSGVGEDGQPDVEVRLGGGGEALFTKVTAENVGKPMAVLSVEIKPVTKMVNGEKVTQFITERKIISVANILQALGNSFQITHLSSQNEANTLALLLRAGALSAPLNVIEERELGPSLGKQNIKMGVTSVIVGFLLVVFFMALYYRVMGVIADLALGLNLILIVAVLSLLGATLTLAGIAGIVLTVGMAADANVLIFERIREELRNGMGVQASIHAGYERALVTIIDSNVTTLIVAIVLFSLGSGTVKNFAVTLTIGLLTSMFTAIIGTRAVVNALYGGRSIKKISIGI